MKGSTELSPGGFACREKSELDRIVPGGDLHVGRSRMR